MPGTTLTIEIATSGALDKTSACKGCVVTFLLEREPSDAIVIDADEARAVRLLAGRRALLPASGTCERPVRRHPSHGDGAPCRTRQRDETTCS